MNIENRLNLQYLAEMGAATALCVGAFYLQKPLLHIAGDSGAGHAVVLLLPIVPIWLMLGAIVRHYRRIDEYQRIQMLKIVSLSAGIGICLCVSYVFAAKAFALPALTIDWAWPIMALCWAAATLLTRARTLVQPT